MPTFALTPVGSDLLVRPLGGEDQEDPQRAAQLDDLLGALARFLAVLVVGKEVLALIDREDQRVQAQVFPVGEQARHLVFRAQVARQTFDYLGAALAFLDARRPARRTRL